MEPEKQRVHLTLTTDLQSELNGSPELLSGMQPESCAEKQKDNSNALFVQLDLGNRGYVLYYTNETWHQLTVDTIV